MFADSCTTPYLLEGTKMNRTTRLTGLALAALALVVVLQSHDRNPPGSKDEHPAPNQRTLKNVADLKLPLSFEANRGQTDSQVKFLARGNGYNLFLTATEAVLSNPQSAPLRMKLVNANPASEIEGLDELPGKSNYFIGSDPQQWRAGVTHYAKVKYRNVYPGVDLVYYGHERQLEYDFVLSPGADPKQIKLAFDGAERMRIDGDGDLTLGTAAGEALQHRPVVYQEANGGRRTVDGRYVLLGQNEVGFEIGEYDASRPLVIDPVLSYATYLGGSANDDVRAIRVDAAGNIYVAGITLSTDFPVVNALQATYGGTGGANRGDIIVAKFNPAGALVYSTYLGGSSDEDVYTMAVDATGAVYLAGATLSTNYPLANALQSTRRTQAFTVCATKLNATGNALVYSTYLGGSSAELAYGLAVDDAGAAYVTGGTNSADFPLVNALQANLGGGPFDLFVTKINPAGSALVFSTFLGGSQRDEGYGIAVDAAGNVYVAGRTNSTNFPLANALQPNFAGIDDAFIVKINSAGSALVYSTYLGGAGYEEINGVAVDRNGNAYVSGYSASTNFPTANAFQPNYGGGARDAFVSKLNSSGNALVYSTYLGGAAIDYAIRIAIDGAGNAYVAGQTTSANFPLARSLQSALRGTSDAFVTKLNDAGRIAWSTLFGGSGSDGVPDLAVDAAGNVYAAGLTRSSDFTVTPNAAQNALKGSADGFIVKLGADVATVSAASFSGATLAAESIVAAFGAGLATTTSAATTIPLPTSLAGTQVSIKDSAGTERLAPLFFVAPNQVNCLIPAGTAQGTAAITITSGDGAISTGIIQIAAVAPGLFAMNANGQGVPAAGFQRFAAGGAQTAEGPVFRFDAATNRFVPAPIDLGPAGEQTFLILFGTGFRNRSALSAVACQIGGETSEVQFAGAQGGLVGLDQANVRIPRSLAGRGEVNVVFTVDGKTANTVTINIR
jgi:uncharacterized protein (TIGR03437 family)